MIIALPIAPTVLDRILYRLLLAAASIVGSGAMDIEPAGDPDIFPWLDIFDDGDSVIVEESSLTRRSFTVRFEGFVERGDGLQATAERNALHAAVVRAVMADETLGGMVDGISAGDRRTGTATLAEHRRLMFVQDFTIEYATDRYDPALPA